MFGASEATKAALREVKEMRRRGVPEWSCRLVKAEILHYEQCRRDYLRENPVEHRISEIFRAADRMHLMLDEMEGYLIESESMFAPAI